VNGADNEKARLAGGPFSFSPISLRNPSRRNSAEDGLNRKNISPGGERHRSPITLRMEALKKFERAPHAKNAAF
jgi:hypothetical protein